MSRASKRTGAEAGERGPVARRWRTLALVAMGVVLGSALAAPPVFGHVSGSAAHLWTKHIRPKADARYYTKAQANERYYDVGETVAQAVNAGQLDGIDSSGFLAAGAKAADSDTLDGIDSTGFVQGRGSIKRSYSSGPFASIFENTFVGHVTLFCGGGRATMRMANNTDGPVWLWSERASTGELNFELVPPGLRLIYLSSVVATDRITAQVSTGSRSETWDAWVVADGDTCRLNLIRSVD